MTHDEGKGTGTTGMASEWIGSRMDWLLWGRRTQRYPSVSTHEEPLVGGQNVDTRLQNTRG